MSYREHFNESQLAVLEARARRIARVEDEQRVEMLDVLQLQTGGEMVAVDVAYVVAIYEALFITAVPCTPDFIGGIANIRGRLVPVLQLGALLNLPADEDTQSLLVVENEALHVALQVAQVVDMGGVPIDDLRPLPAHLEDNHYLRALLPDGTGLLDLNKVLNDPTIIIDDAR